MVSPKAKIGDGCVIYPFAYVEDDVVIGDDCIIYPFVSILNGTRMGKGNKVHQGAVLAAIPQDFHFTGEASELIIGDYNTFRENVIVNRATHKDGQTVIGSYNFLMEGAHISHDTKVGDHDVFGYGTKIAGDCEIGNGVIFSSGSSRTATLAWATSPCSRPEPPSARMCRHSSSPVERPWNTVVPIIR